MTKRARIRAVLFLGVIVVLLAGAAATLMVVKDQTYMPSAPFAPIGQANKEVAVVYYSRTGHTEAVAREIARTFNAPIARIEADYPRTIAGQARAVDDAEAQRLPQIRVDPMDLSPARRVFLVSPTWLFRPAPPLWAFVEQADLAGKEVVLVLTGNSRYEQKEIEAFSRRVSARGGRVARHVFLRRGRICWQKSRTELLDEARASIQAAP